MVALCAQKSNLVSGLWQLRRRATRPLDAAHFNQLQAQRLDSLEHAVKSGLILHHATHYRLGWFDRDVEVGKRRKQRFSDASLDPDFIAGRRQCGMDVDMPRGEETSPGAGEPLGARSAEFSLALGLGRRSEVAHGIDQRLGVTGHD